MMSAMGQTRTFELRWHMSAIPLIAEVTPLSRHVGKVPLADQVHRNK
jgi:hypothetical protein